MERFHAVLLKVWREACRHIEIERSVDAILPLLLEDIPVGQLLVRHLDRERSCLETVAWGHPRQKVAAPRARTKCTQAQMQQLLTWCRSGEVGHGEVGEPGDEAWRITLPPETTADAMVVAIGDPASLAGVLVLLAPPRITFTARQVALLQALREPFSVVLANDHQLRELTTLREAAEAQKQSLLTRMGRSTLADTIVGEATGLGTVMERVAMVASSDLPVLVFGETGTGKELIARAIHSRSPRAAGPIIRVNCGAIPSELIDSELFGHQRGAFTGALETRRGWFERADGGTLFLDEIGEMTLAAQVRLLRILQDGWLERVGGGQPIHVDVRVVAATHQDLARMVSRGAFREDLWYRISVFPIVLPPLRERVGDIPDLARHFAERAATRFGLAPVHPSAEDIRLLSAYSWPGNVRELAAVIDRATILGEGHRLEVAQALGNVSPHALPAESDAGSPAAHAAHAGITPLDEAIRSHIEAALAASGGRIEGRFGAAAALRVNPHTLRSRMRKLGIDWKRFR